MKDSSAIEEEDSSPRDTLRFSEVDRLAYTYPATNPKGESEVLKTI